MAAAILISRIQPAPAGQISFTCFSCNEARGVAINCAMTPAQLHIRRATVDDRATLKNLWASMRLSPDELEKRLTEFQVVENSEAEVVGAIGIQISGPHALLHNEGYSDFSVADAARQLFWIRIQTLAAN